ncbi:MAG TPA: outer membrane protein assembly factor BamD [Candidatus Acidoferrum sp.]|nr:outer membrane protein assembly factor BamD [Candidatus Acidoferrum sp.]
MFTWTLLGALLLSGTSSQAQILHRKKRVNKSTAADNSAEPDKVLYNRALADIKHGRQEVGRLGLQTLINTYPDSEYLAKAKLSIADSYYKEGGTANLAQAIQGYKDFIVFFPFLPEAAYAQLQVANTHYQQLAKPDRDRSEARAAEEEYQTFLSKYPKDPLAPKAEQRLRDVQEIIAEGDYRIGFFYYVKGDKRAAAARLITIAKRYPLYSKSDKVQWMLADIFEKSEHKEIAAVYYGNIVRNYPLSSMAPNAKSKLVAFQVPVPQPDPKAVAWMTAEQNAPRQHDKLMKKPLALVRAGPHDEMIASAKSGLPNLQPESDNDSGMDILKGGNKSQLGGGGAGNTAVVETVTPGGAAPAAAESAPATEGTPAATPDSAAAPAAASGDRTAPAATQPPAPGAAGVANPPTAAEDSKPNTAAASDSEQPAKADSAATNGTDASKTDGSAKPDGKDDPKKESSSKKKKGLKKIIPW